VRAFAMLATYRRNQALLLEAPTASENGRPTSPPRARLIDARWRRPRDARRVEAKALLQAYGIPVVTTRGGRAVAVRRVAARELGYPVALKILSPDITPQVGRRRRVPGPARRRPRLRQRRRACSAACAPLPPRAVTGFTVQPWRRRPSRRS
jgi:acetyltransferase